MPGSRSAGAASPTGRGRHSADPRLYSGAGDGRMVALDARTGALVTEFGEGGFVDLKQAFAVTSTAHSSRLSARRLQEHHHHRRQQHGRGAEPRALWRHPRLGCAKRQAVMVVPHRAAPGGIGRRNLGRGELEEPLRHQRLDYMTVDVERGLVFAPTGSPTSDFYGADRKGQNLYGNSLIALDAATGALKWFRQLVHHDIWDYDLPAAPTLIDVRQNGRRIPAVAQMTKMGRCSSSIASPASRSSASRSGRCRQSDVPGEAAWPTQPFPLQPAPLARTTFDPAKDMYTLDARSTPRIAANCGTRTRCSRRACSRRPELTGRWSCSPARSAAATGAGCRTTPARGLVFTNIMNLAQVARMERRTAQSKAGGRIAARHRGARPIGRFWNPETKVPCSAPPFGELVAVDVDTGSDRVARAAGRLRRSRRRAASRDRHAEHRRHDRHRRAASSSSPARSTGDSGRSTRRPARCCGRPRSRQAGTRRR